MTHRQLLISIAESWAVMNSDMRRKPPGDLIQKLDPRSRELLKQLRSDDLVDIRPRFLAGDREPAS